MIVFRDLPNSTLIDLKIIHFIFNKKRNYFNENRNEDDC